MTTEDITNRQLLDILTTQLTDQFSRITDNMATKQDLKKLEAKLDRKIDNLELRLGRRIDAVLLAKTGT